MARTWSALHEWRHFLSHPAVERALERLGGIDSIERLEGSAIFRAWSGRRYVEFRTIYTEPADPTLGAEVGISLQASEIMLWPLERERPAPARADVRDARRDKAARRRHDADGLGDDGDGLGAAPGRRARGN